MDVGPQNSGVVVKILSRRQSSQATFMLSKRIPGFDILIYSQIKCKSSPSVSWTQSCATNPVEGPAMVKDKSGSSNRKSREVFWARATVELGFAS